MRNILSLFRRSTIGCLLSVLCTLSFLGTAEATPQSLDSHLLLSKRSKCHKRNKLKFESQLIITREQDVPFDVTVTPFITLPNGRTLFGEPSTESGIFVKVIFLNPIDRVPALFGTYQIGFNVISQTTDLSSLTFTLDTLITNHKGKTIVVGGITRDLSEFLLLSPITSAQFSDNFVHPVKE